jgi:hypothetical protein
MRHFITGTPVIQRDHLLRCRQSFTQRRHPFSPKKPNRYEWTNCYIGTYEARDVLAIRDELRSLGFPVRLRGRGPRNRGYDIPLASATKIAVYIQGEVTFVMEQ